MSTSDIQALPDAAGKQTGPLTIDSSCELNLSDLGHSVSGSDFPNFRGKVLRRKNKKCGGGSSSNMTSSSGSSFAQDDSQTWSSLAKAPRASAAFYEGLNESTSHQPTAAAGREEQMEKGGAGLSPSTSTTGQGLAVSCAPGMDDSDDEEIDLNGSTAPRGGTSWTANVGKDPQPALHTASDTGADSAGAEFSAEPPELSGTMLPPAEKDDAAEPSAATCSRRLSGIPLSQSKEPSGTSTLGLSSSIQA